MKDINQFITTTLWNRQKLFDTFSSEYKPSRDNPNKILFQCKYLDPIKSLYLPKYEYLYEFINNTKLKDQLIRYLEKDDRPNEDGFRQFQVTEAKGNEKVINYISSLYTWDFYTVVDFLCSLVKLYREM